MPRDALNLRRLVVGLALAMLSLAAAPSPVSASGLTGVIGRALPKIVKIYGAGGFRGMEAYQSGMLVSADGYVLTVFSYVLDTDYVTVVLNDGRRFQGKLVGADPRLEIAVLKIDAENLPHFTLAERPPAEPGARVLALSNVFGVATGDEPATVQEAVIAARTNLSARRGIFETTYRGPVYIVDSVTNNPGAAGGALVDRRGELVAMLGKELRNAMNNTWLNYAVPIDQLREPVEAIRAGKFVASRGEEDPEKKAENAMRLDILGLTLVPDVLERTPPFVDEVAYDSPAARAGLLPDDLIVLVGDRLIQSCKMLAQELEYIEQDAPLPLTVIRGAELMETVVPPPAQEP
ncbi:MAG: S1C family serine protease [Planctomycetota bacterium]